mmetsp:Transcript_31746/g.48676  ORF Transcript_31746/g.48676 Transcript_31746/m.48676 type:complete len:124 (+) Transcript_31746:1038-1409(+)
MDEALQNQIRNHLLSFKSELWNDREDELQMDKEHLQLESSTKLKQKRDNIYAKYDIEEKRLRQRFQMTITEERERQAFFHTMEIDQFKIENKQQLQMLKQRILVETGSSSDIATEKQQWIQEL